jgi:hypothetical protein
VENSAHVSKRDQFWDQFRGGPLWWAAENGHDAVVKLLLDKDGVGPDSKDRNGGTPLWRAAENGHEAVVKLLLNKEGRRSELQGHFLTVGRRCGGLQRLGTIRWLSCCSIRKASTRTPRTLLTVGRRYGGPQRKSTMR